MDRRRSAWSHRFCDVPSRDLARHKAGASGWAGPGFTFVVLTVRAFQWPFNIWATPFLTNYHFDKVGHALTAFQSPLTPELFADRHHAPLVR